VFLSAWVTYAGYYFCRKNLSVLMPLLARERNYTNLQFAHVIFVFSLGYVAGQFISGYLSDRYGPRRVVTTGAFVSVAANLLMGIWQSPTLFLVLELVNGLGQSTGWSGICKLLAAWFSRAERGVVTAWWSTNYVLGGFLASVFATWMATNPVLLPELGWRRGMFGPALVLAAVATLFLWAVRNNPRDAGLDISFQEGEERPGEGRSWPRLLRNPNIQAIAAMYFLLKLARYSLLFWLPLYFSQKLHYSDERAGYTSSVFEMIGFLGPIIAGYVSDRLLGSRRFPVGAIMLWALGLVCLLHPLANLAGFWGTVVSISVIGILVYGPDALMSVAAVQDSAGAADTGMALGYVDGIGSCGQLLSAYVIAGFVQWFGWDSTFTLFSVLAILAGLVLASRWEAERRDVAPAATTAPEPAC
jgi:sugar phosphate permease